MTNQTETTKPEAPTEAGVQVERVVGCLCATLCYATELDMVTVRDKRHHPACPLHKTEKYPRLFYYEEAEDCWTPAPDRVDCIVSIDSFTGPDDRIEIDFKRLDMTDEEFYNLPEV